MCHDPQRSVSAAQGDCYRIPNTEYRIPNTEYRISNIEYADRSWAPRVVVAVESTVGWKMVSGVQATIRRWFRWSVDGLCRPGKKDER